MLGRRVEAIRRELASRRLDALVVSELTNVRYLTGFTGSNGLCLITPRRFSLVTDSRYTAQAHAEVRHASLRIARRSLIAELANERGLGAGRAVGFESEHLTVAQWRNLRTVLPDRKLVPTASIVERVSAVKERGEIVRIRRAAAISDAVMSKVLGILRPGVRENEIAAEISYWHRKLGADSDAFEPIVASGPRGALPHAKASERKIRRGEFVTLDIGCRYQGYNSDITRTVAVGKPPAELVAVYDIVRDAQQRAIDAASSGVRARDLDGVAREWIASHGYGRYFIHSLGHGLGIHLHDPLRLSALSADVLAAGNVVTIEPGIYLPGRGGVRIEDDIVITARGCVLLTHAPRDLIVV